jgi:TPR repeat protein
MTTWILTGKLIIGAALLTSSICASPPDETAGRDAFLKKDYATAYRNWKPLADAGDANAQFNLAILYERGLGVRRDLSEAFTLCHLAAAQGLAAAEVELGRMYARGWGTAQRFGEALQWFEKAADQGDPNGQENLGWLYDQGYGVARDYKIAAKYYRLAAEHGNAEGQYALGELYLFGNGVAKDPIEAYCLFLRAELEEKKAADELARLNQKLTGDQISQALKCAKAKSGK